MWGQDAIRVPMSGRQTTVIGMATVLHTIATGKHDARPTESLKTAPIRPVYFYMVDTAEFAVKQAGRQGEVSPPRASFTKRTGLHAQCDTENWDYDLSILIRREFL
jgi:hypothetical protein